MRRATRDTLVVHQRCTHMCTHVLPVLLQLLTYVCIAHRTDTRQHATLFYLTCKPGWITTNKVVHRRRRNELRAENKQRHVLSFDKTSVETAIHYYSYYTITTSTEHVIITTILIIRINIIPSQLLIS